MNVRISTLPQIPIPATAKVIFLNDQLERALHKVRMCTGKTNDEIKAFVTGNPISYSDLADFAAAFGRFPDLHEQKRLMEFGMGDFIHELREYWLKNISQLVNIRCML